MKNYLLPVLLLLTICCAAQQPEEQLKKLNIDLTPSAFKKLETKELIEDTEKTLKSKEVELNSLEKELEILKLEKNEILDKSNLSEMYNRKF